MEHDLNVDAQAIHVTQAALDIVALPRANGRNKISAKLP
jgi:hypothetical protein